MVNYERMYQDRIMEKRIMRVGAYCRVSTDREDQTNSFESQQRYFKEYIERNPEWVLSEIFADEGTSGTSTKKRKAFNRMIACAKAGEVDLIITKEISRFARNTLDSIFFTRELKRIGVGVIFLNDNINTLEPDAELRLTIMSSIAQEESRKTSDRVKWGQKRRMEQGVVFGRDMLGYDVRDGQLLINEDGAEIVRLIFHKFVNEMKGTYVIARELREAGILTLSGIREWSNTAILRIIRNEKYCGDLVQKKTFTPDYLSHDKKCNRGEEEFVVIQNHHEAIISREMFEKASGILESRSVSQERIAKHSNRYAFSGKIKCGVCGISFVSRYKTRKNGSQYKAWRCNEAVKYGRPHIDSAGNQVGCSNDSIRNEDAEHIMSLVVKSLNFDKNAILENLVAVIDSIISRGTNSIEIKKLECEIADLQKQQARLIELYMGGNIKKEEFMTARAKSDGEIAQTQGLLESVKKQNLLVSNYQDLMNDIEDELHKIVEGSQVDEEFYRHILNQITVHNSSHIDVYLNLLPHKWSYAILKDCEGENGDNRESKGNLEGNRSISSQDIPISFKIPLTSGLGAVKR